MTLGYRGRSGGARWTARLVVGAAAGLFLTVIGPAGAGSGSARAPSAVAGPTLSVDAAAGQHPISPLIYGMNAYDQDPTLGPELDTPIIRLGGDATSRYNWEQDSSNSGADWYFMGGSGATTPVPSAGPDALVAQDKAFGAQTMLTVPIIPYINKTSATNCSFPSTLYPSQQSWNPDVTLPGGAECGNGLSTGGTPIADTDVALNNTPNSPAYEAQWIQHLVATFGTAAAGGVGIYEMDNEPSGWDGTHRDIHPAQTGWDELVGLTEEYAAAVKSVDPTAAVDGPGDFGWAAYVDDGPPGDDQASHGGSIWEAQYYLQQLAAYQAQHGVRLLDYFDEHYYPTTPDGLSGCIALCEEGDATTQAARLESTRSLWDPTYVENDWIGEWYGAIDLIPRMKSWVNQYYPGTKTAISEYNFGALDSLNGALTEADVLGIFGYQGLDMATLWGPPSSSQPGAFAFRMYRNYDGDGSKFGDTSVSSTSSDQGQLSVYGALRSTDGAMTVMVINKTANDLTSPLDLSGFNPGPQAQVYTYDDANLDAVVPGPDQPVSPTGLTMTYPADSITLLVIPPATTAPSTAPPARPDGYREVAADGGVFSFGGAGFYGSMGGKPLNQPIVGIASTPDDRGYWEVAADGGIFSFGDADFFGSMGGRPLAKPIVGIAATPDGGGYWEVAADGGVFSFGDAAFFGSMGARSLAAPIVGLAATPDGGGYWEVASDGGVFGFGDADFFGSVGGRPLVKPIVAIAATHDGGGYWEVASDGGVFSFGDADFFGSMGGRPLVKPIVAAAATPDGGGYWEVASDGGVFSFGDAPFFGSMGGKPLDEPIVAAGT
ncbi:MAG: glycoside hydrolase family 44 protein [Acidimicrobiales bacterium]